MPSLNKVQIQHEAAHRKLLVRLLLIFSLCGISATWQNEKAQEGFRIEVNFVPVSVTATDARGGPVSNLELEDFSLFENGIAQKIVYFSGPVRGREPRAVSQNLGSSQPTSVVTDFAPLPRHILIVLGRGRHHLMPAVEPLKRYIRTHMDQNDQVAVLTYDRITSFAQDFKSVAQLLERYQEYSPRIEAAMELREGLEGFREQLLMDPNPRVPESQRGNVDNIFDVPGLAHRTAVPPKIVWELMRRVQSEQIHALNLPRFVDVGTRSLQSLDEDANYGIRERILSRTTSYEVAQIRSKLDMKWLGTAIEYLRYVSGEKEISFLSSQGLFVAAGIETEIGLVAADAGVKLYNFQTGRLAPQPMANALTEGRVNVRDLLSRPSQTTRELWGNSDDSLWALHALRKSATLSGGEAFVHQDMEDALEVMAERTGAVYVLGYVPKDTSWKGELRRIEVKASRKDVRLQHRAGYFGAPLISEAERERNLVVTRTVAAAWHPQPIKDIDLELVDWKIYSEREKNTVELNLNLKLNDQVFESQSEEHKCRLVLAYFVQADGQEKIWPSWDQLSLNLSGDDYQRSISLGIPVKRILEAPEPLHRGEVRIVVYDLDHDIFGTAFTKFP